ncbi:MAG TPA: sortase [Ktedonobacteraceae bacterium]|nr:sortase [Ktedonobacteraceae bacterium]
MKKVHILFLSVGVVFLGIGLALGGPLFLQYWRDKHLAKATPFSETVSAAVVPSDIPMMAGHPVRFQLPALGIDLTVIDGHYNAVAGTWTLSNDKVQYATVTPQPNNKAGNTFLYGHNRPGVFKTLNKVKAGDEVILTTDNNLKFTYRFRGAVETNPNDDSLFHYSGAPILTVQTCSGLWYQNRQLFTFDLIKVETI